MGLAHFLGDALRWDGGGTWIVGMGCLLEIPGRASLPAAKLIGVPNAPVESHFLFSQSRQRPEVFLYSLTFLGDGTNGTVIEAGGNGEKCQS